MPHEVVAAFARAVDGPTIFVLEDVHWADEATLDVLRLLARRVETIPVLVVATYRDDELDRTHPLRLVVGELATSERVTRRKLSPLSPAAVAQLADPHGFDTDELFRKTVRELDQCAALRRLRLQVDRRLCQGVQEAARWMLRIGEDAPVQQGRLEHGNLQTAEYRLDLAGQVRVVEYVVQYAGDDVDGDAVDRRFALVGERLFQRAQLVGAALAQCITIEARQFGRQGRDCRPALQMIQHTD